LRRPEREATALRPTAFTLEARPDR